jgi:hypothetical protein
MGGIILKRLTGFQYAKKDAVIDSMNDFTKNNDLGDCRKADI